MSDLEFRVRLDTGGEYEFRAESPTAAIACAAELDVRAGGRQDGSVTALSYRLGAGEWYSMDDRLDPPPAKLTLHGSSGAGRPRQEFADLIARWDDIAFTVMATGLILAAAQANADGDAGSDYSWKCDALIVEARRRRNPDLYQRAFDQARASAGL